MSAVENSEVVRELCEAYNRHDLPAILDLCADDCTAVYPRPVPDPKNAWEKLLSDAMASFPDGHVRVLSLIAQWDQVALEIEWKATQTGAYRGRSPTGRTFDVPCVLIFELADTRIRRANLYLRAALRDLHRDVGPEAQTGGA